MIREAAYPLPHPTSRMLDPGGSGHTSGRSSAGCFQCTICASPSAWRRILLCSASRPFPPPRSRPAAASGGMRSAQPSVREDRRAAQIVSLILLLFTPQINPFLISIQGKSSSDERGNWNLREQCQMGNADSGCRLAFPELPAKYPFSPVQKMKEGSQGRRGVH